MHETITTKAEALAADTTTHPPLIDVDHTSGTVRIASDAVVEELGGFYVLQNEHGAIRPSPAAMQAWGEDGEFSLHDLLAEHYRRQKDGEAAGAVYSVNDF